jgi:hypothetical protein
VTTCPSCKTDQGDPLYHGPAGHAPQELCYDCWLAEWEIIVAELSRGGNWGQLDSALYLLCQGFSHGEASDIVGVCRKTLYAWIRAVRQHPETIPQWFLDLAEMRRELRSPQRIYIEPANYLPTKLPARRRYRRADPELPPGLRPSALSRIPPELIEDAAQEAWVAHLSGQSPAAAVWRHVKRVQREMGDKR